jgi:ubiquitin C-terminal hydrolase
MQIMLHLTEIRNKLHELENNESFINPEDGIRYYVTNDQFDIVNIFLKIIKKFEEFRHQKMKLDEFRNALSPIFRVNSGQQCADEFFNEIMNKLPSLASLFLFEWRTVKKCRECKKDKDFPWTLHHQLSFNRPLKGRQAYSTLLKKENANVTLEVYCDHCRHNVTTDDRAEYRITPNQRYLIMYIRKYAVDRQQDNTLMGHVTGIDIDGENIFPLLDAEARWRVVGFTCKTGTRYGGHYTAYIQHAEFGWINIDCLPPSATPIDINSVDKRNILLIFFEKL